MICFALSALDTAFLAGFFFDLEGALFDLALVGFAASLDDAACATVPFVFSCFDGTMGECVIPLYVDVGSTTFERLWVKW